MELSTRKKQILAAIVKTYIETGEPVGSKALSQVLDLGLSPATLRNEMSELSELGYLEQPHTSAGRVPTSAGYRLYIQQLMRPAEPDPQTKAAIDDALEQTVSDPERMVGTAGQVLADLTGLPALSATVANESASVKRVETIPMGRRSVLLVMITSDGVARSRLCRLDYALTPSLLERFARLTAAEVESRELSAFQPALLQTLVALAGEYGFALMPLLAALFQMVDEVCESTLSLKGESNLFGFSELEKEARQLIDLIARRDAILSILAGIHEPVEVVFGGDTPIEALRPSSLVVARYKLGDKELGRIGVIGPTRMAYEQLIPSIEYFAAKLGSLLTQALEDMEDDEFGRDG